MTKTLSGHKQSGGEAQRETQMEVEEATHRMTEIYQEKPTYRQRRNARKRQRTE